MNYWLRLYTGIVNDPKVQLLPDATFKGWINLLCLAKENDGSLPPVENIAFTLRMSEAAAAGLLEELTKRGLLDADGETLKPHNWDERQFVTDNAGERNRQHKEKLAAENGGAPNATYVYFIGTTIDRIVKIGYSKNPWARVNEFQTGSPEKLNVIAAFRGNEFSEWDIHQLLAKHREHGEWFTLPEGVQRVVVEASAAKHSYAEFVGQLRYELRAANVGPPIELRSTYVAPQLRSNDVTTTETEYRAETETESEQSREAAPASRAKPRSARRPTACDEDFLAELQANPAYAVFDVKAIYHRMVAWCGVKGKQPTRARLVNWLNREDRPMTACVPTRNPYAKPTLDERNKAAFAEAGRMIEADSYNVIEGELL